MNYERLLDYLQLDDASQFEFFENLADLVEADMEIAPEAVYRLFDGADKEVLCQLIETYFEDVLKSVPEDEPAVYTMLDAVKLVFMGMCRNLEEETDLVLLADEFCRFRNWYSMDSCVWVQAEGEHGLKETEMSLRDALSLVRLEKLGGEKYEYSFDEAMDFEMDQYTMSFADLLQEQMESGQEGRDAELEGLDIPGLEYTDRIFTPEKLN